ncbi:MAG: zinc ribbon domain-containing protein [Halothermotrichaceae bacterium]
MVDKKADLKILIKNFISTIIGLVILLVFRAIVVNLSAMETEVFSDYDITIASILSVVILCLVGVLVFRFYKQSKPIVKDLFPGFEGAATLFENIIFIFIILIGYFALEGVIHPFLAEVDLGWLYQLIFVGLAVYPVYKISTIAIDSSDTIVDTIFKDRETKSESAEEQGKKEAAVAEDEEDINRCSECGAPLEEGNKFCVNCGAKVE